MTVGNAHVTNFPALAIQGSVTGTSSATLLVTSDSSWQPVPNLPLVVPPVAGSLSFTASRLRLLVTHQTPFSAALALGQATLTGVYVTVEVTLNTSTLAVTPTLTPSIGANVRVGGVDGFGASMTGQINLADRSVSAQIHHSGGWMPIPGALGAHFVTPAFDGSLDIGINGVPFHATASVGFANAITLSADTVTFRPGLNIFVDVLKASPGSVPMTAIKLDGAMNLGNSNLGLPDLVANGTMTSIGDLALDLQTSNDATASGAWTPLPSLVPAFSVPKLFGQLRLQSTGAIQGVNPCGH